MVCRDFFNLFMPKRLRQIAGFNFGFRANTSSRNKSVDFWQGETPAQRVVPPSLALTSSRDFIPIIKLQIKPRLLPDIAPIISANGYDLASGHTPAFVSGSVLKERNAGAKIAKISKVPARMNIRALVGAVAAMDAFRPMCKSVHGSTATAR